MLRKQLRPAIVVTLVLMLITGVAYPAVVTAIAQLVFPRQANGSLINRTNGAVIGSSLIGQSFARPEYFSPKAVRSWQRLRRHSVWRHQQGSDRSQARGHAHRSGS